MDRAGLPSNDPGLDRAIAEATDWLIRAQDCSRSADGGVARHFSLVDGWSSSYPETTGYIVPTFFELARRTGRQGRQPNGAAAPGQEPSPVGRWNSCQENQTIAKGTVPFSSDENWDSPPVISSPLLSGTGREDLRDRARRMLDWLVSIQLPGGAFQGGPAGAEPVFPAVFDTGQILMGLAAGVRELGDQRYVASLRRAADWLIQAQADDGSWPVEAAPFALPGAKTYETHVAWGLMEAFRASDDRKYLESALANVRWAMGLQHENGWFDRCCLQDYRRPLTHTLGYTLRGIVEAYRLTQDKTFLDSAQRCADGLLSAMRPDGGIPGRLDEQWQAMVPWVCLTGSAQIAICWLLLFQTTGNAAYRDAAFRANAFVRRTVRIDGPLEMRGGVKGSFPVDGGYGRYQYLNWACKFFIDANLLEQDVRLGAGGER